MKQNTNLKSLLIAMTVALGAVATAQAQDANVAVPNPADTITSGGLIGSRYTQVEYNYIDLSGSGPSHANGFGVTFNQPVNANFDASLNYDWARAKWAGVRGTDQVFEVGATAYTTLAWGRPYAMATAGWDWQKVGGLRDDSFIYRVGVGMEFLAAPQFSVTPFVNFVRATGFNANEYEIGAKATYRVNASWSVTARAQYEAVEDDDDSAEYSIGLNYHF
ncbi:hypothetical protein [Opitutus terrae]|uniref:Outer membrane protein beta-barrel domain-containing protein n=1 Tax=Opitutus terrae (strain DSM 11246 / JCM 15787 / PB90-1) TaxID=452637 RepID=B1ZNK6_OPITP|nr:hypothetical protein [Opitutus terrae]ACB74440.1 hypothetical protein Oter_1152 [Opitutus terrae PB90-1]